MILQTAFVCFRTQQSQVRNLGTENKSATPNAVVRWPSYIVKGHPLHQHSRGRTDFHCYLFSMNTFVQDAAWSSLFTAGQAENVKPTPRSAEVFPGCACPQRRGLAASPPVAIPAGAARSGSTSPGTAASQHVQQLFEGGD